MMRVKKFGVVWLAIVFFLAVFSLKSGFSLQVESKVQGEKGQTERAPEKITPTPKNIKEQTAIYIFVAWMWAAILVLLYILRQKIKEEDRVHQLQFFSEKK